MTSDIALSGVACTSGVTPRQLVQSSSENDKLSTTNLAIHIGQIDARVASAIDFSVAPSDTMSHESFQDTGI